VAIYNCSLTDALTGNTPLWLTPHTQAAYVLGNRKVNVPFNLTFYAITGETVTTTVLGVPTPGTWPSSDLGSTVSISTNVQFTKDYYGVPTGCSSYAPSPTQGAALSKPFLALGLSALVMMPMLFA